MWTHDNTLIHPPGAARTLLSAMLHRGETWRRAMGDFAELSDPAAGSPARPTAASYAIDEARLPVHLRECVVTLAPDEACVRFLDGAQDGALKEMLCGATAALLSLCLTLTDLNAWLRRGEMWVLSTAQAKLLVGGPFQRLLDVGAGTNEYIHTSPTADRNLHVHRLKAPTLAGCSSRGGSTR